MASGKIELHRATEAMPPPQTRHRHWFLTLSTQLPIARRKGHFHLCIASADCFSAAMGAGNECQQPAAAHVLVRLSRPARRQLTAGDDHGASVAPAAQLAFADPGER